MRHEEELVSGVLVLADVCFGLVFLHAFVRTRTCVDYTVIVYVKFYSKI